MMPWHLGAFGQRRDCFSERELIPSDSKQLAGISGLWYANQPMLLTAHCLFLSGSGSLGHRPPALNRPGIRKAEMAPIAKDQGNYSTQTILHRFRLLTLPCPFFAPFKKTQ